MFSLSDILSAKGNRKHMIEEKRSLQQNMLFNTVGSIIYYVCQWLMSVIIVRMSGYEDGGVLALAMSITAAPSIVALFNVRSYQVSDTKGEFSNKIYIVSRRYTNILSFLICVIMVLFQGYSGRTVWAILAFMVIRISEGIADVYYGIEQKQERMDYAGISLAIRGIGMIGLFVVVFLVTGNLVACIVTNALFSLMINLIYDKNVSKRWYKDDAAPSFNEVMLLLKVCYPLAIVAFLNNLSVNLIKLFLEQYHGEEIMGIYSSVSSPTMVIQLAATTLFAPFVPILTEYYVSKQKDDFMGVLRKFIIMLLVLLAVCLIGAALLGEWGLVLLFSESIRPYTGLFVPVVVVSFLIAINACLFSICTLLRQIKPQYIIGFSGVIASFALSVTLVKAYSMNGVIIATVGTLVLQIIIQIILIAKKIKQI